MITTEAIINLYTQRKRALDPRIARMAELRSAYEGDIAVPLPDLGKTEKPMVANLIAQGLDQVSMRIASTMPDVRCLPLRPGIQLSEAKADDRRAAILGWWSMNRMALMQRQRARWLVGYACSPVVLRPDAERSIPRWQCRDPLTTFPPPGDDLTPLDCIFAFTKTLRWLRDQYPDATAVLAKRDKASPDDQFTIVEYDDADETVLCVIGDTPTVSNPSGYGPPMKGRPYVELARVVNRAGICPAVVPGRICLHRRQGQFDGLVGLFWWQSKIMALEGIAMERDIFPDEWFIGRPGENPVIVTPADGRQGMIGEAVGGVFDRPGAHSTIPAYQTVDRIERAMRLTGGIPAEFGGESTSNIRTGRRGGQVLSSAIDFPIQEAQQIFEASLEEENIRAIAIDKAWFGARKKAFYFSWNGKAGRGEYIPNETWETDQNEVSYSFPGSDINQLTVGIGQRVGMGIMSKHRGMELDPLVRDPAAEAARIDAEALHQAFIQGIQQQASQGIITPIDLARITQLVVAQQKPLYEAVIQVQKEAQARQATSGPPGTPEGPVPPGSPEAQPGLGAPGQGAEAGISIPEGPASIQNLSSLLGALRRPAAVTPGG